MIKFMYSEKATKFCEIFTLHLTGTAKVRWRFCKFLWPSQNIWTLLLKICSEKNTCIQLKSAPLERIWTRCERPGCRRRAFFFSTTDLVLGSNSWKFYPFKNKVNLESLLHITYMHEFVLMILLIFISGQPIMSWKKIAEPILETALRN